MSIKTYKVKAAFTELKKYCHLSDDEAYMEITRWNNGEGFDVSLSSHGDQRFYLTDGEFRALKKLIKKLDEDEIKKPEPQYRVP